MNNNAGDAAVEDQNQNIEQDLLIHCIKNVWVDGNEQNIIDQEGDIEDVGKNNDDNEEETSHVNKNEQIDDTDNEDDTKFDEGAGCGYEKQMDKENSEVVEADTDADVTLDVEIEAIKEKSGEKLAKKKRYI